MKTRIILIAIALFVSVVNYAQNSDLIPKIEKISKLPSTINTIGEEVKPIFNSTGTIMYFVRTKHPKNEAYSTNPNNEDIWESIKNENGIWAEAEHEATINNDKNNSIIGKGKDDHYFLLNTYQDKKHLQYGIALTKKLAEHSWTKPEIVEIPELKYEGDFYDFFISKEEDVLLISIKGADSKGEEDLYICFFKDGNWSKPINLGSAINTTGFEMSPFLSADKKVLYFSSNGQQGGFGDADIYVAQRLDETWTNWSAPINLGNKVNSSKMDCYFNINERNEYFFSSNRDQDNLDIYQAFLEEPKVVVDKNILLNGIVSEEKSGLPLSVSILIKNSNNPNDSLVVSSDASGYYSAQLKKGNSYTLKVVNKGYNEFLGNVQMPDTLSVDSKKEYNIKLQKLEVGIKINLERLYFVVSTDSLIDISLPVVEKLANILNENPDINIRIEGHTDNTGTPDANAKLSLARAKKIQTLLEERGIKKKRMTAEGFGETRPLVKNLTEEDKQLNRRVDFVIVE